MRPSAWEYILRISTSDFKLRFLQSRHSTPPAVIKRWVRKIQAKQKNVILLAVSPAVASVSAAPLSRPRLPPPFCRFPVRTAGGIELDPERIRFSIILDLLLRADQIPAVPQPFLGERGGTVGMIFVGIRDLDIERMVGGGIAKPAEPGPNPLSTEIDQMFRQFFPILVSLLEHRLILFVDRDGDEHVV